MLTTLLDDGVTNVKSVVGGVTDGVMVTGVTDCAVVEGARGGGDGVTDGVDVGAGATLADEDPPLGGEEEPPPEQRPEVEGFGKTKGFDELASWQALPSQRAPELTGRFEGGLRMMV